jgi:hypothetical protein
MAHSLRYLMDAVDIVRKSVDKNESDEMQEKKLYNLCTIAEGFKKELEFQNYLVQLVQTQNQIVTNENKQDIQNKKYLLAQMIKLHIIELDTEMENTQSRLNLNSGAHLKKSPMISRKRPNSPPSSPPPETIFEEISFEELDGFMEF